MASRRPKLVTAQHLVAAIITLGDRPVEKLVWIAVNDQSMHSAAPAASSELLTKAAGSTR